MRFVPPWVATIRQTVGIIRNVQIPIKADVLMMKTKRMHKLMMNRTSIETHGMQTNYILNRVVGASDETHSDIRVAIAV